MKSHKANEYSLDQNQKCNICYNFYSNDNLPYVLKCGHTFCKNCIEKIFKKEEKRIQCAFDKKTFQIDSINEIPINFSYLQILKAISQMQINNNCRFTEDEVIKNLTFDELSSCKTILDLSILRNHPHLKSSEEFLYEKLIPEYNNSSIFQKFCDSKKFTAIKKNIYDNGEYFEGSFQHGKKQGWGRKSNKFGIIFEGFYNDGSKEGYGIEISKTLDIYIGQFLNNLKSGNGVLFYNKSESKYVGNFFMNKKHGKGKDTFSDKSYYEGNYVNGMRTGKGCMTFSNGNFLKGEFFNGKLEGEGKEQSQTFKYKGKFRAGVRHGYGLIVYEDGNMYKGDFCEGKMHGKGEFRYSNGNVYVGAFFENKKQGEGRLEIVSDSNRLGNTDERHGNSNRNRNITLTYIGEFLNDYFDGQGVLCCKDVWTYRGEFKFGMKSGYGVILYDNKDEYKGYFQNDMKNGKGEIYYADRDSSQRGMWRDDYMIKSDDYRRSCNNPDEGY